MSSLQKYYRQPKIYIQLPSKGLFYPSELVNGDHTNVPILAMTGMDELLMKTPDALFNSEATVKLIESCCPYFKDGNMINTLDIDTVLAAIRLATFGDNITVTHKCTNKECQSISDYEIELQSIINHYSIKNYDSRLTINDLIVSFRPLTYKEMTMINIETYNLRQLIRQIPNVEQLEDRQKYLDDAYAQMGETQIKIFIASIESIQTPEEIVTDPVEILEWLGNCDREYYTKVKEHLDKIKDDWSMPKHLVTCDQCAQEDQFEVSLDQSHFFV